VTAGDESPGAPGTHRSVALLVALTLLAVLAVTFLLFYLSGLYLKGVSGRVGIVENPEAPKEDWRIVPAPDVEVLITWDAQRLDSLVHSSSRCVRAVLTHADRNGEFKIDGHWLAPTWPPLSGGFAASHAIKPGYYAGWDYQEVAPAAGYSSVLGPAPRNPWTGLLLEDEDGAALMRGGRCPPIERL
jgi:hypothetical protein